MSAEEYLNSVAKEKGFESWVTLTLKHPPLGLFGLTAKKMESFASMRVEQAKKEWGI